MTDAVYETLEFPTAPLDRPYAYINMVTTIDGKSVSGTRDEDVQDLGTETDHATMRAIEFSADAVLIGAGSLRATAKLHYAPRLARFVVSRSGDLDFNSPFFAKSEENAWVVTAKAGSERVAGRAHCMVVGDAEVDLIEALRRMRVEMGVSRLLIEGGSELNASLLALDVVDELFLTMAPLVKLGRTTPTYADGEPLGRKNLLRFSLVSSTPVGDEVYLRYQRRN
ncbi:MAG: RibD family protein [Fimbriimonadaceae bacterium]